MPIGFWETRLKMLLRQNRSLVRNRLRGRLSLYWAEMDRRRIKFEARCALLALLIGVAGLLRPSLALAAHTHPSLILSAEPARPGETVMAGVRLRMDPGWHTYWRNPGGPGIPTSVEWALPHGVTAGEIQWPIPEKLVSDDGPSYIYEKEVILLVPLTISPKAASGPLQLKADVGWLECEKECVPGKGSVQATLNVGTETKPSKDAALIETWQKKLPAQKPDLAARAWWEKPGTTNTRPIILEWTSAAAGKDVDFFPYASDKFDVGLKLEPQSAPTGKIRFKTEITKSEGAKWPDRIAGLFLEGTGDRRSAVETIASIAASEGATPDPFTSPTASVGAKHPALWFVLVNAFLGGMILNIMPCVLPVIGLKILSFVNEAKNEPREVRRFGLIYAAGILASFLLLAGSVIAAQLAGHAASWGSLFQIPQFVLVMTVLMTLVSLNLFGVFEVNLSGGLMGGATNLASKTGAAGAFFNGALATVLATPCTAPFLAGALGFAFILKSPGIITLVFLTAGLGLATPYIILSWHPAWLKLLPKPGAWMEKFKVAMGFPILGTAVWLFTLAAPNFGENGAFWLGILLVIVSMAAWIWGQFVQRGRSARGLAVAISLALVVLGGGWVSEAELDWRHPMIAAADNGIIKYSADGIEWHRWSPEAIQAARAEGRPILVDFTASWCATCHWNLTRSIEVPEVRAKLKEINAIAFVENSYTKSATVVAELNRYQRAGVPLVLVYPSDPNAPPEVLPDGKFKAQDMLDALDKAARQKAAPAADTASSQ
jgi:thiol:disulfide interchange protein